MPQTYTKQDNIIRIGTRGSELALAQANEIRKRLEAVHPTRKLQIEIKVISTAGDRSQKANRALSEIGGKGLFTLEIEEQLSSGEIDMAVHSTKDMPTTLPEGLGLVCFPERENVADAFIARDVASPAELPVGAIVGSASLRRKALMLRMRPDLNVIMFRGNVGTRLAKIAEGQADATLLAVAGLSRLNLAHEITCPLPLDTFPPAPGQGAICVEAREDNTSILELLAPLNHRETEIALNVERSFLKVLDGSCKTPIAAHAKLDGDMLFFHGMILKPDGSQYFEHHCEALVGDSREMGEEAAQILKSRAGSDFFADW